MKKLIGLLVFYLFANLTYAQLKTGAEQMNKYIPLIKDKKVAIVANHTSIIQDVHLVDTLLSLHIHIAKILSPEHGFRGNNADGAIISDSEYGPDKIPIISLYGNHKKPTAADLKGIDVVIFDMQDVGVRCYTYISTMSYVMEACAENNVAMIVLDRPNPNIGFVDGPVLKKEFASFVGLHEVPYLYGMTIGEYANMMNGEGWLNKAIKCDLKIMPLSFEDGEEYYYHHLSDCEQAYFKAHYKLPIAPSPNLPNMKAVALYPHLCLFEGTDVSVGRGTNKPFQIIGKPNSHVGNYYFTPISIPGVSDNPPHLGKECQGIDLSNTRLQCGYWSLSLEFLLDFYQHSDNKSTFFKAYFDKLAGTDQLRKQIIAGWTEEQIRESWKEDLQKFKLIREKYLLYSRN